MVIGFRRFRSFSVLADPMALEMTLDAEAFCLFLKEAFHESKGCYTLRR
jgi:hypothetical protein